MPAPANDNFANATLIAIGGTLTGDNTDATSDGASDPLVNDGFGLHTIWYRLDSTDTGLLTVETSAGGGSPIGDTAIGVYQGTTLAGLTMLATDDDAGTGFYSKITDLAITGGDPIYIEVTGYDDTTFGTFTMTWTFTTITCINSIDVINPSSLTASVVSGRVRESYDYSQSTAEGQEPTLVFTWTGSAGAYEVSAFGRMATSDTTTGAIWPFIRVNGRQFTPVGGGQTTPGADFTMEPYPGWATGSSYTGNDYGRGLWVNLAPGDEVEVLFASVAHKSTSPFNHIDYDSEYLCFTTAPTAPTQTETCSSWFGCTPTPVGDNWGSPKGWGGMRLIPDEVFTDLGVTPYDEADFAPGLNFSDYDFSALGNGVLYSIVKDVPGTSLIHNWYVAVKKYNPGTDTWSQVALLNTETPTAGREVDAVACETDGTYIYFTFWEWHTVTAGPKTLYYWHLFRLDPSDDSIVELGTGQNAYGVTNQSRNYPGSTLANNILPIASDNIYVASIEKLDLAFPNDKYRVIVWHWDGASWTDISLPAPSNVGVSTWEVVGEFQFYDRLTAMVAAFQDGPVTTGFTLTYQYLVSGANWTCTIQYEDGVGWTNEILTDWVSVEGSSRLQGSDPAPANSRRLINPDIHWSENLNKLVLVGDLEASVVEIWDMWVMNDAGTQWEVMGPIPASSSTQWAQARNTSAVGPDGEIYRGMKSFNLEGEPIIKSSPGYNIGFAPAGHPILGEDATEDGAVRWEVWDTATAHRRLRIVGQTAYLMDCAGPVPLGPGNDGSGAFSEYGDGIYIWKFNYTACATIVVFGSIKYP